LYPGCAALIKFSYFACQSEPDQCSYSGLSPTKAPTYAALTGNQVVSGSMTLAGITADAAQTPSFQTSFKSALKTRLSLATLSDNAITLTITAVRRRLSSGVSITYKISGVSEEVSNSAAAAVAAGTFNSEFTSTLSTELTDAGVTFDASALTVTADPTSVTTLPPTKAPTKAPTVEVTTAIGGASSHTVDALVAVTTVVAVWATIGMD